MNPLFNDYEKFVDKFKPKLTTDDCYTPDWCYDLVCNYIDKNVHPLDGVNVVRPFWPGADYKAYDYKPGDIVIDNPPFSILASIVDYYVANGISFWLWAPVLTIGGLVKDKDGVSAVICGATVTYANGAQVRTGFVTNLFSDRRRVFVAGDLSMELKAGEKIAKREGKKALPKYDMPDEVITSARLQRLGNAGVNLIIKEHEAKFIRSLASQRESKNAIYGGGWLISHAAAARAVEASVVADRVVEARHAAGRPIDDREAIYWPLSDSESKIIDELSVNDE